MKCDKAQSLPGCLEAFKGGSKIFYRALTSALKGLQVKEELALPQFASHIKKQRNIMVPAIQKGGIVLNGPPSISKYQLNCYVRCNKKWVLS